MGTDTLRSKREKGVHKRNEKDIKATKNRVTTKMGRRKQKMTKAEKSRLAKNAGNGCFYIMLWMIMVPLVANGIWKIYAISRGLPAPSFWFWLAVVWILRFIIGKLLKLGKRKVNK
jgi:hypothetical protein